MFHARGVVFKGSGFYVTDSRKPNPASAGTNGKASGERKSQGGDASSNSKSATDKSPVGASKSEKASSE